MPKPLRDYKKFVPLMRWSLELEAEFPEKVVINTDNLTFFQLSEDVYTCILACLFTPYPERLSSRGEYRFTLWELQKQMKK